MGIGDWGLGIGDWGLPNPQSPIPKVAIRSFYNKQIKLLILLILLIL